MNSRIPFVENSLYRFESDGMGIYAAVERDCPRDDIRRHGKPDGAWLPRVGPKFPGAVSYFTETGLAKYVGSGLMSWHCKVVQHKATILETRLKGKALYADRFQVICDPKEIELHQNLDLIIEDTPSKRRGVVFWDFDGTLAHSTPMWSRAAQEVLAALKPNHSFDLNKLKKLFGEVFPWHNHQREHKDQTGSERWWPWIEDTFYKCFIDIGVSDSVAKEAATRIKTTVLDPHSYRVIDGAIVTLAKLRSAGWRHAIISNHVPELSSIVESLGLGVFFDQVISSGNIGYEKPHRSTFEHAVKSFGSESEPMWMIGDNPRADIEGAQQLGIPGILVKNPAKNLPHACSLSDILSQIKI